MPVSNNEILEITCKLTFGSVSAIRNVYHVRSSAADSSTNAYICERIAEYMADVYAEMQSYLSNNLTPETIQVVSITNDEVLGEVPWPVGFTGGTGTANSYALGVAAVLRLLTGYRGVQGRKFYGPLTETTIGDDALLIPAVMTAVLAAGSLLLHPIEIVTAELYFGAWDRVRLIFRMFVEAVVSAVPGYQRRRKQGRGI
jgi:hypothetical protein